MTPARPTARHWSRVRTHVDGKHVSSALLSTTGFTATSSGYLGTSDGWTDLGSDHPRDWSYRRPGPGNIAQAGQVPLGEGHVVHPGARLRRQPAARARRTPVCSAAARRAGAVPERLEVYLSKLNKAPKLDGQADHAVRRPS